MTRYFMTIQEAGWLILDAAAIGTPGDLFVLDMGDPVRILDMARDLVRLAGRDPQDVEIIYTGLRPGEKLTEKLYYDAEMVRGTEVPKISRVVDPQPPPDVRQVVMNLMGLAGGDHETELREALFAAVAIREGRGSDAERREAPEGADQLPAVTTDGVPEPGLGGPKNPGSEQLALDSVGATGEVGSLAGPQPIATPRRPRHRAHRDEGVGPGSAGPRLMRARRQDSTGARADSAARLTHGVAVVSAPGDGHDGTAGDPGSSHVDPRADEDGRTHERAHAGSAHAEPSRRGS
jgi:hypothetical protein